MRANSGVGVRFGVGSGVGVAATVGDGASVGVGFGSVVGLGTMATNVGVGAGRSPEPVKARRSTS